MSKVLDKIIGEGIGMAIPGGKLYYKTLSKGINWINKIVKRKKSKAESQKEQAEARLAQLQSLNFQGLQNAGVDQPYTAAQSAVFGRQESETKISPMVQPLVNFATLTKDGNPTTTTTKLNGMEWIKKNWYYVAGGAAVLYYLMKKKGR